MVRPKNFFLYSWEVNSCVCHFRSQSNLSNIRQKVQIFLLQILMTFLMMFDLNIVSILFNINCRSTQMKFGVTWIKSEFLRWNENNLRKSVNEAEIEMPNFRLKFHLMSKFIYSMPISLFQALPACEKARKQSSYFKVQENLWVEKSWKCCFSIPSFTVFYLKFKGENRYKVINWEILIFFAIQVSLLLALSNPFVHEQHFLNVQIQICVT